ncbi:MAG TPA: P-type conjugative transfer protein TrbJ [Caulobacterales bacterium]|nr:P-type conjugative transfer protein TrbJ [Caulobacterales bacterium]
MQRRNFLSGLALAPIALALAPGAEAQMTVIDPTNLIQNALTAARTLQQINNQIRSLENEARNLLSLGRTFAPVLLQRLQQIDSLIDQARGVALRVQETREALQALYSGDYSGTSVADRARQAQARIDASREALRSALLMQAEVTQQIRADRGTLEALSSASQGVQGALAAQQATNELLSFQAEQNLRLQALLIAESRAEAIERAREMEVRAAARAEHQRFFQGADAAHSGARPWN